MQPQSTARRLRLALVATAVGAALVCARGAGAASKVSVATLGQVAPGGTGQFLGPAFSGSPSAAGSGWVAFRALVTGGGTAEQIIARNLAPSTAESIPVASLGGPAGKYLGNDLGTFKEFLGRPTIDAKGDVAFVAILTNSQALPADPNPLTPQPAGVFLCVHSAASQCTLQVVAVARQKIAGLGMLDFSEPVNPFETSASHDLFERTPALNDVRDVAFTVAVDDPATSAQTGAAIIVAKGGANPAPVAKLGDKPIDYATQLPLGAFVSFGPPAMNHDGVLAFRAFVGTDDEDGIFRLDPSGVTRLVNSFPCGFPTSVDFGFQTPDSFDDHVTITDAGAVSAAANGLVDLSNLTSVNFDAGAVVIDPDRPSHGTDPACTMHLDNTNTQVLNAEACRVDATPECGAHLVSYPGRSLLGIGGRIVGATLGPDGDSLTAAPTLGADGTLFFYATLSGGRGQAFFKAPPPSYDCGDPQLFCTPVVRLAGTVPGPTPLGGLYGAAVSPPIADAAGDVAFFARLFDATTSQALVFLPAPVVGDSGTGVRVGDASPSKGALAGQPFAAPSIGDDDTVVFRSALAGGSSGLGMFRWRGGAQGGLEALVRTGDVAPIPGRSPILDLEGQPSVNRDGALAFSALVRVCNDPASATDAGCADGDAGHVDRGVFASDANGVRAIALVDDFVPSTGSQPPIPADAQFAGFTANPTMLADGSVLFRGIFEYQGPFLSTVREVGLFRVDGAKATTILARTAVPSPTGTDFFDMDDPATSDGATLAFTAPLGSPLTTVDPKQLPIGIFLIDPTFAVRTIAVEGQSLGGVLTLGTVTGRPGVDAAGNVAFLETPEGGTTDQATVVRRNADGTAAVLAQGGAAGPAGGTLRSLGRPAMSSNGHVAFRVTYAPGTGGVTGYVLATGTTPAPFVQVGESASADVGGTLTSLNATASLNASDHLAFIAQVSSGTARSGIFAASPTTLTVRSLQVRIRSNKKLVTKGTARGRLLLKTGDLRDAGKLDAAAFDLGISDAFGPLFSATLKAGDLVKSGGAFVPKSTRKTKELRGLRIAPAPHGLLKVAFTLSSSKLLQSSPSDVQQPIDVRVDVGGDGGATRPACTITPKAVHCHGP